MARIRKENVEIIPAKGGAQNIVQLFLASKRQSSRTTYYYSLQKIARKMGAVDAYSFDWSKLRYEHITMINAWLRRQGESSSAHLHMSAVKGVLEVCYDMGLMSADEFLRASKACAVKVDSKPKQSTGRMLSMEEIKALLITCQKGSHNRAVRDAAIIMCLVGLGLRRAEITTLQLNEYDRESGKMLVHGKGGKIRSVYLVNGVKTAMSAWLKVRGDQPGPIFLNIRKSDELVFSPLNCVSVWSMLKWRGEAAGLAHFEPHDMRRTYISNMLPLADIVTIADLVGHVDPAVTARYDRRPEERKADAAALINIPFMERGDL